jgi:putative transcriptional regulator
MAPGQRLQTVAETKSFSEDIDAMLSRDERDAVVAGIAADPDGGDLIQGTGGLRKRRIALPGRGKRGGARLLTLNLGDRFQSRGRSKEQTMKKKRFDRLIESLAEVREHVAGGRFAGRIHDVTVEAEDIRAVRKRSGLTQTQFAATFGIGLGTLQKWERGERRPSGAAKSLLRVMQADLPSVVQALGVAPERRRRSRAA